MSPIERKKVILFNPEAVFYDMPLALLSVGSALDSEKYEVVIIDARIEDNYLEKIKTCAKDAICFGVTVLTGKPLKSAIEATKLIKEYYPEIPVIWGGWHTSLFPKQTLIDQPGIDVTVQGQGENTFVELIDAIAMGQSFEKIKGICYRSGNDIIQTPPRVMNDMNNFERINYGLVDVEKYFQKKRRRQFDFISSIGCFFRCSFCADPFVYQRKFSSYDPIRLADDIEYFYHLYKFTDVNFQDETFFTYPEKITQFAKELIKRNITISWACTMRADQGFRMSEEQWETCKKSGLRRLLIGVESGSQEMMDWLEKDIKIDKVLFCANQCKKYNIDAIFPFIVGFPGESDKSVRATVNFIKKLKSIKKDFQIQIFYFKPYPGSKITQEEVKAGYQLPTTTEEWSAFDYVGSIGPWVSKEKYLFFENFKFYMKLAWGQKRKYLAPISYLARWRCKNDRFIFPIERKIAEIVRPQQKLS